VEEPTLLLNDVYFPVTTLGPGNRLGVWMQGCGRECAGCLAQDTWDPAAGRSASVEAIVTVWEQALEAGADGLTVSGGEPLEQVPALALLLEQATRLRDVRRPDADVLVYTGFSTGPALRRGQPALQYADAIITGRYVASRPTSLVWRGSTNQEMITLTPRGTARYRDHLERQPTTPTLQVTALPPGCVRVIGVPRAGDLPRVEADLRRLHVEFKETTWHS
jgi:anaerobic ribonucleoside-triphosphate reductase activating protein